MLIVWTTAGRPTTDKARRLRLIDVPAPSDPKKALEAPLLIQARVITTRNKATLVEVEVTKRKLKKEFLASIQAMKGGFLSFLLQPGKNE
jgi:hypothetical protein